MEWIMTDRAEFAGALWDKGIAMRRQVAGDVYVDAALAKADDYTADLQKLVTETAWAMVWTRPGLPPRDRSMVTVSILIAQGKLHELKTHLRGALNNGVTRDEIKELMLHAAIYAGFPSCLEAFRVAGELFSEIDGAG
jgi:4-carboxymuconolactone decarboxylase